MANNMDEFREALRQRWASKTLFGSGSAFPVVGSDRVHNFWVVLGIGAAMFYTYFALFPPLVVVQANEDFKLPRIMANAFSGSLVVVLVCILARGYLTRGLLFSSDVSLSSIVQDPTALECIRQGKSQEKSQEKSHLDSRFMPKRSVLIACGLACLPFFVTDGLYIIGMLLPISILGVTFGLPTALVLHAMEDLSWSKVDAVCVLMENHLQQDIPTEKLDAQFWTNLTKRYLMLDRELEQLWSTEHCGPPLFADLALRGYFVAVFFVVAVASPGIQVKAWCVAGATLTAMITLQNLGPLASITALCQSQNAGTPRSVRRLAVRFCNCELFDEDAKAEHARFLQAVTSTPVGLELPIFGMVTTQLLASYAKVVVTAAPVAITFILKAVGNEPTMAELQ